MSPLPVDPSPISVDGVVVSDAICISDVVVSVKLLSLSRVVMISWEVVVAIVDDDWVEVGVRL